MSEVWREILLSDLNGRYEVSSKGNIRSVSRMVRFIHPVTLKECFRPIVGKVLLQNANVGGYPIFNARVNGRSRTYMVHALVALAFIEIPERIGVKLEVNHKNGVKLDNDYRNLEWVTNSENKVHAYSIGLRPTGKDHHFANMERDSGGRPIAGTLRK